MMDTKTYYAVWNNWKSGWNTLREVRKSVILYQAQYFNCGMGKAPIIPIYYRNGEVSEYITPKW